MTTKRIALFSLTAAIVVITAGFLVVSLIQQTAYNKVRHTLIDDLGEGLKPVALEPAQLEEIKQWNISSATVGDASPHAMALNDLGKEPNVKNLVELLTTPMQPYAWFDWQRNRENTEIAVVLAVLFPITVDGSIHISDDGSTAFIIHSDGYASLFTQTDEGLLDELRYRDQPEKPGE